MDVTSHKIKYQKEIKFVISSNTSSHTETTEEFRFVLKNVALNTNLRKRRDYFYSTVPIVNATYFKSFSYTNLNCLISARR